MTKAQESQMRCLLEIYLERLLVMILFMSITRMSNVCLILLAKMSSEETQFGDAIK